MKVLHIGKYFPPFCGGMETFLRDLAVAQVRAGLTVAVLAHDHAFGGRDREEAFAAGEGVANGSKGEGMNSSESMGSSASPSPQPLSPGGEGPLRHPPGGEGPLRRPAGDGAVHLLRAATRGAVAFTPVSPGYRRTLGRLVREWAPDVIHIHMPNPNAFWLMTLSVARRIPWVVHWHSDVVASPRDWRLRVGYSGYRPFEQRLLRRARAVVVTSEPYLRSSAPLRPWADRCEVIPLGMDAARLAAPAMATDPEWGTGLRVLAVGRLTYYKGFENLVRAAALEPRVQVRIVGEGEQRPLLEREIRQAGIGERVRLLGRQGDEAVAALMRQCDLLCLPSVERTEAFGMVLLEAMACAKPCLVTDVQGSGMSWVVEDRITGLVVRAQDVQSLAGGLAAACDAKPGGELAAMGRRGHARFERELSIERTVERLNALYRKLSGGQAVG